MKYFLDCEFNEHGHEHPIELISIALVCEDGSEFYAVAKDGWRLDNTDDWVFQNVLPRLKGPWLTREEIKSRIWAFILKTALGTKPVFWGYFADYDWVLFCQLFGRMVDLPEALPKYCLDIKQEMETKGIKKKDLPKQEGQDHNALDDARHTKKMYDFVMEHA